MAELIDKNELKKSLNITGDLREYDRIIDYPLLKEIIAEQPTTTEAEIRAKALDDFIARINKNTAIADFMREYLAEVAEQLKEE